MLGEGGLQPWEGHHATQNEISRTLWRLCTLQNIRWSALRWKRTLESRWEMMAIFGISFYALHSDLRSLEAFICVNLIYLDIGADIGKDQGTQLEPLM